MQCSTTEPQEHYITKHYITKGEHIYWCSRRQHNALRAGMYIFELDANMEFSSVCFFNSILLQRKQKCYSFGYLFVLYMAIYIVNNLHS